MNFSDIANKNIENLICEPAKWFWDNDSIHIDGKPILVAKSIINDVPIVCVFTNMINERQWSLKIMSVSDLDPANNGIFLETDSLYSLKNNSEFERTLRGIVSEFITLHEPISFHFQGNTNIVESLDDLFARKLGFERIIIVNESLNFIYSSTLLETSTAGGTSAGNIATVNSNMGTTSRKGAIGVGFDPDADWGVYEGSRKDKNNK